MADYDVSVKIVPDTSELKNALGKLQINTAPMEKAASIARSISASTAISSKALQNSVKTTHGFVGTLRGIFTYTKPNLKYYPTPGSKTPYIPDETWIKKADMLSTIVPRETERPTKKSLLGGVKNAVEGFAGSPIGIGMGMGVGFFLLQKITSFIATLSPIKAILLFIQKLLTIFFLPPALMFMEILLPFLMFVSNMLKTINFPMFIKMSTQIGQFMAEILNQLFTIMKPYLPEFMKALELIMIGITVTLIAPLLAIAGMITGLVLITTGMAKVWMAIYNFFTSIFTPLIRGVGSVMSDVKTGIDSLIEFLGKLNPENLAKQIGALLPHFQHGGHVYSDSLAFLHAGERVVPAGGSNSNYNNITINATVSNDIDMNKLADTIQRRLEVNKRRSGAWSG